MVEYYFSEIDLTAPATASKEFLDLVFSEETTENTKQIVREMQNTGDIL